MCIPLDSPAHGNVSENEWRHDVKNLAADSSPCVEERSVEGSGKWALGV